MAAPRQLAALPLGGAPLLAAMARDLHASDRADVTHAAHVLARVALAVDNHGAIEAAITVRDGGGRGVRPVGCAGHRVGRARGPCLAVRFVLACLRYPTPYLATFLPSPPSCCGALTGVC